MGGAAPATGLRRAPGPRLPYRGGMIVSALGLGAFLCGLLFRGALHLDGSASLELPRLVQRILAKGGFRLSADAVVADPRVIFLGMGITLLLVGAALLLNDWMHREALRAASAPKS